MIYTTLKRMRGCTTKMSEEHITRTGRIYRDGKWYTSEEDYTKHIKEESTMTYDTEEELHRATDDMPDHSILDRDDSDTLHERE